MEPGIKCYLRYRHTYHVVFTQICEASLSTVWIPDP
jgi:hypothetical protein